uniref:Transmembrane protein n=1 Tax=Phlebia radiata TaxID=5308 RepID=L8B9B9_PHLRA|nr:hypothetical protein PRA_mt0208 [Phlebia radiata]CCE89258.1 hypothetical protein PRA_mt0208 [Phlebia radiata]
MAYLKKKKKNKRPPFHASPTVKERLSGSKPNIFCLFSLGCLVLAMFIKLKNFFCFFAIAKGDYSQKFDV